MPGDHVTNSKGKDLLNFFGRDEDFLLNSPGTRTFISMNPQGSSGIDLSITAGAIASKLEIPWVIYKAASRAPPTVLFHDSQLRASSRWIVLS